MSERRDEAKFLEEQADQLDELIDFSKAQPAVFPNLKASLPNVTAGRLRQKQDETKAEPNRQEPRE